jgi:hypothetical protein
MASTQTTGPEVRANDPQALAQIAGEAGTVPSFIIPPNPEADHRPNGHAREFPMQTQRGTGRIITGVVKAAASGLIVGLAWLAVHFSNSTWFNQPVNTAQLSAVTYDQRERDVKLEGAIAALTRTTDSQGRALDRLNETTQDTRTELRTLSGYIAGLLGQGQFFTQVPPARQSPDRSAGWQASVK